MGGAGGAGTPETTLPGGGEQTVSDTGQEALERTTKFNLEKLKETGCPVAGMIVGTVTSYLASHATPLNTYTLNTLTLTYEDNTLALGTVKIGG